MDWPKILLLLCSLSPHLQTRAKSQDQIPAKQFKNTETLLTRGERKARVEMLLKHPKATFFYGENMTGDALSYDSRNATLQGVCLNVKEGLIQSMEISETCVRVFKGRHCTFLSRALYPTLDSGSFINFLTSSLDEVRSVGPCLPNEFQYANVLLINGTRISITKDVSNSRQVPDFADFIGWHTFSSNATVPDSPANPVKGYYMDGGRPKWIEALITSSDLKNGTGSSVEMNLAIPPKLGAPANEAYNTFPQSQSHFEEWKKVTSLIQSRLRENYRDWARLYVTFVYENSADPKPVGFFYCTSFRFWKNVYGFIEN